MQPDKPRFQLVHIVPTPRIHGLYGYSEVIETVRYGLAELGYEVSVQLNNYNHSSTNIFFGAHVMPEFLLAQLPPGSIIYNFEQIGGLNPQEIRPSMRFLAANFAIWDYSKRNIDAWRRLRPKYPPRRVPVGCAPTLRRIARREIEDIDVLFYGLPSDSRFAVLKSLCESGLKCVFACGLYGPSRDDLIARAKLVLNLNIYQHSRIFEIVRVSYLLANAKAVVSDMLPDAEIEPDLLEAVAFAAPQAITTTCRQLIADDQARATLAVKGQQAIERRDIKQILKGALDESNSSDETKTVL